MSDVALHGFRRRRSGHLVAFTPALIPAYDGVRGADPNTGDTMQMAIYATLGVFLLLAVRNPRAYCSVIAFAAWSSFAHAATMGSLGLEMPPLKNGLPWASGLFVIIGVVLLALLPKPATVSDSPARPATPLYEFETK